MPRIIAPLCCAAVVALSGVAHAQNQPAEAPIVEIPGYFDPETATFEPLSQRSLLPKPYDKALVTIRVKYRFNRPIPTVTCNVDVRVGRGSNPASFVEDPAKGSPDPVVSFASDEPTTIMRSHVQYVSARNDTVQVSIACGGVRADGMSVSGSDSAPPKIITNPTDVTLSVTLS
jgi:hypothetical protein